MKHALRLLALITLTASLAVGSAFAAAATASQTIAKRDGKSFEFSASNVTLLQGVMWARNASGYIVNASDATGLVVVGIGAQEVDNSAGSAGDLTCIAERGIFKLANDSGTPVTDDDVNSICYVLDNATVSGDGGTYNIIAGLVRKVDSDGVWVDVGARLDTATPADASVTTAKLANAVADQITVTTVAVANTGTPDGVANVTGQVKDAQGNALSGRFVVTVWFATSGAWAAPADLGTLTAKTNSVILKEDTDDAFARVLTHSDGSWGLELDTASDGTVHAHATVGGAPAATANAAITGN